MRHLFVVVSLTLIATACTGDDDAASTTSTVTSIDTTVSDTTEAPTTTAPESTTSTTAAPTTTAELPTTTGPVATTAPATLPADLTEEEFEALRDDIIVAAVAAEEAFDLAKQNPTDEAILAELRDVMTAERRQWIADNFIVPYVIDGLEERPNPDVPFAVEPRAATLTVDLEAGTASLEICTLSSNLLVEPGGNSDGSDQIHDDRYAAVLVRRDMVFVDGRWLDDGGVDLSVEEGETECDE